MNQSSCGLFMIGPLRSRITAYDMNKGTILRQVSNGGIRALGGQGKTSTGAWYTRDSIIVTAGGLILAPTIENPAKFCGNTNYRRCGGCSCGLSACEPGIRRHSGRRRLPNPDEHSWSSARPQFLYRLRQLPGGVRSAPKYFSLR